VAKTADPDDLHHMRAALVLARRGLGVVWPNPAVGCVLVRQDRGGMVVGRGWTQAGGRPHAETEALRRAGAEARGATAYVTLEPCNHHGQTPPCTEALLEAGVARVVIAHEDPNPEVSGRGVERLRAGGVTVEVGLCHDQAAQVNAGFFLRVTRHRPMFTLKVASTLDGRIATRTGASRWITNAPARAMAHRLRADHDAVMIGIGTALADDPDLTCRLPGLEGHSPVRIIVDTNMRLPLDGRLTATAHDTPTWLVTVVGSAPDRRDAWAANGVTVIEANPDTTGRPDLGWVATELGSRGLTRVLVEGGGTLAAALLRLGLVDRLAWFHAPSVIGGDGVAAVDSLEVEALAGAPGFTRAGVRELGMDLLEMYTRTL